MVKTVNHTELYHKNQCSQEHSVLLTLRTSLTISLPKDEQSAEIALITLVSETSRYHQRAIYVRWGKR